MLTKFAVSGYRNFADETVLDLAHPRDYQFNKGALKDGVIKCGLIYGKNAVGKTNFGSALLDAHSSRFAWSANDEETPSILNADKPSDRARFTYEMRFDGIDVRLSYERHVDGAYVFEQMDVRDEVLYRYDYLQGSLLVGEIAPAPFHTLNFDELEESLSALRYVCSNSTAKSLGVVARAFNFIKNMRIVQGNVPSYMPARLAARRLAESGKVEDLERFLNRFGIREKLVVRQNPSGEQVVYFDKKRLVPFYRNCSSGTRSLLGLYNALETNSAPSLLFIDEFDACYHHELAEALIAYFKEQTSTQIICTTHNTDLFSNRMMRPDCLFILSESGLVVAADATSRELREGHNLEKLFKAGEFDA